MTCVQVSELWVLSGWKHWFYAGGCKLGYVALIECYKLISGPKFVIKSIPNDKISIDKKTGKYIKLLLFDSFNSTKWTE